MRAELECGVPQNSIMPQETVRKSPCTPQGHQTLGVQMLWILQRQAFSYVIVWYLCLFANISYPRGWYLSMEQTQSKQ